MAYQLWGDSRYTTVEMRDEFVAALGIYLTEHPALEPYQVEGVTTNPPVAAGVTVVEDRFDGEDPPGGPWPSLTWGLYAPDTETLDAFDAWLVQWYDIPEYMGVERGSGWIGARAAE